MNNIFRSLLVISGVLYVAFYFMPQFDYLWLDAESIMFLSNNGANAILALPAMAWDVIFLLWLLCIGGMYFYVNMARRVFAMLLVVSIALTPFNGYVAYSPIEYSLVAALDIIDGALVVIAFFTSVSQEFE